MFDRFDQIYNSIARRAFEIFEATAEVLAMSSTTGLRPNPNCFTRFTYESQNRMRHSRLRQKYLASKPKICRSTLNLGG